MTYNNYLPDDELYGESKLKGIYRISFDIQVESANELSLSDVAQALTEGFGKGFGEDFVSSKVADLSIEKVTKRGQKASKVLKVGDMVSLKNTLTVKADIYSDDGYVFIGQKTDITETVGKDVELSIEAGSLGYVNKIADGKVDIANLDKPITSFVDIGIAAINVDLLTVSAELIERIVDRDE